MEVNLTKDIINNLIQTLDHLDALIKNNKAEYDSCLKQLNELLSDEVASQLADKDYGSGTATLVKGDWKVKAVVGKRVKYDQKGLKSVIDRIKEAGKNPDEYVKVKYDVSETAYKNWPSDIKSVFEPYREVSTSPVKFTWEKV